MFSVLFCAFLFYPFLFANAVDDVVPYKEGECRILLIENRPNAAKNVQEYVERLGNKYVHISLTLARNVQEAVDSYTKGISASSSFCCVSCFAEKPPTPFNFVLINLGIASNSMKPQLSCVDGVPIAQELRGRGYAGPICAITGLPERIIQKLKTVYGSCFTSWGGEISSHTELDHMIRKSGERLSPHAPYSPIIVNKVAKQGSQRPLTPRPQDLSPPVDNENFIAIVSTISSDSSRSNSPIQTPRLIKVTEFVRLTPPLCERQQ